MLNLLGEGEQTLWHLVTAVSDYLQRTEAMLHGGTKICSRNPPAVTRGPKTAKDRVLLADTPIPGQTDRSQCQEH